MGKNQKIVLGLFVSFWMLFFLSSWIKSYFFPIPKIASILLYVVQFDLLLLGAWLAFKVLREIKKGFGVVFLALFLISLAWLVNSIILHDFLGSQLKEVCPDGTVMNTFCNW